MKTISITRGNCLSERFLRNLRYSGGVFLFWMLIVLAGSATAWGQDYGSQAARILEEPFRLKMDEEVPLDKRVVFDWGGWFRSSVWDIRDYVDRDLDGSGDGRRTLRRQQLRLWGQLNLDNVHRIYTRGRLDYLDWNSGSSFDGNDSDLYGPKLDRLWYDFNLQRALMAQGEKPGEYDFSVRLGRQYVEWGTGLALSTPLDALLVEGSWRDWSATGLLGMSVGDAYNIDQSFPGNSKESRRYWGVKLNYEGWRDHEPFAYFFAQEDQDDGSVRNGQSFGYNSNYTGLGSRGRFFHKDLQYSCEFAVETGENYARDGIGRRQNIMAWGFDTELRYLIPDERESQVSIEYLLTSGDPDRGVSPSDTVGGNLWHTNDSSFVGWGYRNTGLALAPRLSNLGMVRLGYSTFPAKHIKFFEKLLAGTDFFVYHKQRSDAVISDDLSTQDSKCVGAEIDFYMNWRLASDVAWTVRYGVFIPGSAFSRDNSRTDRQHFFTGVTLNF
ncbi:MAG: alginate export family protein [Sedimentisphaerales bacterium]|nr:alginate export family protein [Sedimentisphaerales bacterium]